MNYIENLVSFRAYFELTSRLGYDGLKEVAMETPAVDQTALLPRVVLSTLIVNSLARLGR